MSGANRLLVPVVLLAVVCGLVLAPANGAIAAPPDRYTIPGAAVFPEGITTDAASGQFYVGSTGDGTVFRGAADREEMEVFLPGGADGRTSAIGMKVDGRGRLFIAGGATGGVFVYDIGTRRLISRLDTGTVMPTFLNDVAIAPDGTAFVTNSSSPVMYRVTTAPDGQLSLERWLTFDGTPVQYQMMGANLNGLVVTPDGRYILTSQSNTGSLYRIEIATKAITEVNLSGQPLRGDGLILEGPTLYAVAGGQLLTTQLAADFASGTVVSTLADPTLATPTTVARLGDYLLIVNAQFSRRGPGLSPDLPFTVTGIYTPAANR